VKDYLSIAYSSHFSVILGLILLGVVFFIPNGIVGLVHSARASLRAGGVGGLVQSGRAAISAATLADVLEGLAHRLRRIGLNTPALPTPPSHPSANGVDHARALEARQIGTADQAPPRRVLP
jgi:hypothetical protein